LDNSDALDATDRLGKVRSEFGPFGTMPVPVLGQGMEKPHNVGGNGTGNVYQSGKIWKKSTCSVEIKKKDFMFQFLFL
jgi:hypothetical protein